MEKYRGEYRCNLQYESCRSNLIQQHRIILQYRIIEN